jgi:hypothetical protein
MHLVFLVKSGVTVLEGGVLGWRRQRLEEEEEEGWWCGCGYEEYLGPLSGFW